MALELGAMKIRTRQRARIELAIGRATAAAGWTIALASAAAAVVLAPVSTWLAGLAFVAAAMGVLVATAQHRMAFDTDDGVLRIERRIAGLGSRAVIPLFHLRALVVRSRGEGRGFIAVVERRVGDPIVIDTRDRPGPLYDLVRAIADVTELRLVYDATRAS